MVIFEKPRAFFFKSFTRVINKVQSFSIPRNNEACLLELKKQDTDATLDLEQGSQKVELEIRKMLDTMFTQDSVAQSDFSNRDYLLAAYSACLKVLTSYRCIDGMTADIQPSQSAFKEVNPIKILINRAVTYAHTYWHASY